jgi:protein SCO1/2
MGQARIQPRLGRRIPLDLTFDDSTGKSLNSESLFRGRPVILHLVYYECPMLCKLAGDGLLRGLEGLDLDAGEAFDIVTLSFDPTEGVELSARAKEKALLQYNRPAAATGWHFLSGDEASIRRLTDAVGFYPVWDSTTDQYAHPSGVFVLTPDGVVSRYLSGIDFRARDLRLALVEASAGQIGSVSDQLLMLCYQYDPTTGRYGLAIMSAMRAAGITTVIVLVGGIWLMLCKERKKRRTLEGEVST